MARVLITGCSSGLGRATAEVLTSRGHDVIATARRAEDLADLQVRQRLAIDVCDQASVSDALRQAGDVEVLINNAGVNIVGPVELTPIDDVVRVMDTNLLGALRMIQGVLPQMRARRAGQIINISSLAGRRVRPMVGVYAASKFALEVATEALRFEVAHLGIRVSLVEPGPVATRLAANTTTISVTDPDYAVVLERSFGAEWNIPPAVAPVETAALICSIVEDDAPALRVADEIALAVLKEREQLDDAGFEQYVRARLDGRVSDV